MKNFGKWLSVLAGLLYVFFALYLFFNPLVNLATISWLFAFFIFMGAVSNFVNYFTTTQTERRGHLFYALINLIFAILFLAYGYLSLPILIPTIVALAIIASSIGGIVRANRLKQLAPRMGKALLGLSIVGLLLGVVLLFNPMIASILVSYIIALGFVYAGVNYLLNALARLEE